MIYYTEAICHTKREGQAQLAEKVFFTMSGYGSLECWSRKTSHYSSHRCNDDDEIYKESFIKLYLGDEGKDISFLRLDTLHLLIS